MSGVMRNVAHLCTRDRSKTWGKEGWKKIVVCIVSDGRKKVNSRTLASIATIGCYQDGVAKVCYHLADSPRFCVDSLDTECCQWKVCSTWRFRKLGSGWITYAPWIFQTAHLYEYTTQSETMAIFIARPNTQFAIRSSILEGER